MGLSESLSGDSTCVLPISVGWYYHEDKYFYPTLDLVNKKFAGCRVVVCDTLQRYSLRFLEPANAEVERYARALGDRWLERHSREIEKLSIPYKIERWDDRERNESYLAFKKKLEEAIEKDDSFAATFYRTAARVYDNFVLHDRVNPLTTEKKVFIESSVAYLIEECAVVLTWKDARETVLLYPKNLGEALYRTMDAFWGSQRDFLLPLQIRFKKLA